jgi:hypothetical protein
MKFGETWPAFCTRSLEKIRTLVLGVACGVHSPKLCLLKVNGYIATKFETSLGRLSVESFDLRKRMSSSLRNSFFFVGWDLRHQVLRPLLAYCTAPDDG